LFVDGELVGGCDIMTEMFESGELKTLLDTSAAKREQAQA
jgi:monothiol glutaredoxin